MNPFLYVIDQTNFLNQEIKKLQSEIKNYEIQISEMKKTCNHLDKNGNKVVSKNYDWGGQKSYFTCNLCNIDL